MYKVGDWLKNIHTGHLVEISEVFTNMDGIHNYCVKKLNTERTQYSTFNYSILQSNFELLPLARLLYKNNITSEVIK